MNREILFRGKRLNNREWVQGSLISFIDGGKMILPSKSSVFQPESSTVFCSDECYQVDPDTVGQYTGLTDKNGVRVFGGDILKSRLHDGVFIVEWLEASARYTLSYATNRKCHTDFTTLGSGMVDVIGNIYDTPELLNGGAV